MLTNLLKEFVALVQDEVLDMRQVQIFFANQLQKTARSAHHDLLQEEFEHDDGRGDLQAYFS